MIGTGAPFSDIFLRLDCHSTAAPPRVPPPFVSHRGPVTMGRSALGIEHPRSAVIARNLALVRGAGRLCSDSIANSGCLHQEAATGEPGVGRWEGGFHYGQGGW